MAFISPKLTPEWLATMKIELDSFYVTYILIYIDNCAVITWQRSKNLRIMSCYCK